MTIGATTTSPFWAARSGEPERTIPRAILLSVLFVAAFYVTMNLAALPAVRDAAKHAASGASVHLQLAADDCADRIWPMGRDD